MITKLNWDTNKVEIADEINRTLIEKLGEGVVEFRLGYDDFYWYHLYFFEDEVDSAVIKVAKAVVNKFVPTKWGNLRPHNE